MNLPRLLAFQVFQGLRMCRKAKYDDFYLDLPMCKAPMLFLVVASQTITDFPIFGSQ